MTGNLMINKPYLEIVGDKARLCAKIDMPQNSKIMYFEVDSRWKKYLCFECADAFVVALLDFAMIQGYRIVSEAPINKELYFHISNYIIPVLNDLDSTLYKRISIETEIVTMPNYNAKAVGCAVSGGVDSFFTILKHVNYDIEEYRISHVFVTNLFNRYTSESETRKRFADLCKKSEAIAKDMNLEIVEMYCNHHDFLYPNFAKLYSYRLCSNIFALQKLFRVYYISSGAAIKDTNFYNIDSDDYDVFNLSMMTTSNLKFYSSGGEVIRTEKVKAISDNDVVRKHLYTCTFNDHINCSICHNCVNTMTSLEILGKLNDFNNCFDVKKYNKVKAWSKIYEDENYHLNKDLIDSAKKYNYRIPMSGIIIGRFILKPASRIKMVLKKNGLLKKIYFKFKIDYLLYGKNTAEIYRYGRDDI